MDTRDIILTQQAEQIASLTEMIWSQSKANEALTATVAELQTTIAQLNERIKELQEQLGQNSQNSSNPPSSDSFGKKTKSNRTPFGTRKATMEVI